MEYKLVLKWGFQKKFPITFEGIGQTWDALLWILCKASVFMSFLSAVNLIDFILYPVCFHKLKQETENLSAILSPERLERRHKRRSITIYITF